MDFTPPFPLLEQNWYVNIVYLYLKSEKSHDNAQKTQRNCTFKNSAQYKSNPEPTLATAFA